MLVLFVCANGVSGPTGAGRPPPDSEIQKRFCAPVPAQLALSALLTVLAQCSHSEAQTELN